MKFTQAEIDGTWSERAAATRILASFLETATIGLAVIGTLVMTSRGLLSPQGAGAAFVVLGVHSLGRLGLYELAEDLFKISTLSRKRRGVTD